MSIKEISKSASWALGTVYMEYVNSGGMAYNVYSKPVMSVVEPIYCSGIWGHNRYSETDSDWNKAYWMDLGISKMSQISHAEGIWDGFHVTLLDLEICPITDWWQKCINTHWIGVKSWEPKSKKPFETLQIDNLLYVDSPCKVSASEKPKENSQLLTGKLSIILVWAMDKMPIMGISLDHTGFIDRPFKLNLMLSLIRVETNAGFCKSFEAVIFPLPLKWIVLPKLKYL